MTEANETTALAIFFIATAVVLIGGLVVIPLTTTAMAAGGKPPTTSCLHQGGRGGGVKVCGPSEENCEAYRAEFDVKAACHEEPLRGCNFDPRVCKD